MQGQPQDRLVVLPHQFFKRRVIAPLRLAADQNARRRYGLVLPSHSARAWGLGLIVSHLLIGAPRLRTRLLANRYNCCPRIGRHCLFSRVLRFKPGFEISSGCIVMDVSG